MLPILQVKTTILPGNRIEICSPDLPPGHTATVVITVDKEETSRRSFREVLGNYQGGELFQSAKEVEDYLSVERDSWDN